MPNPPQWATSSGDVWAERWLQLDRGLAGVAEHLDPAILAAAPAAPFRALDIGCGAGSTSLSLAIARPDAAIVACDLSPSLVQIAEKRLVGTAATTMLGDAEDVAGREGPFDLFFSRHGVMFFDDPPAAFRTFRQSASPGASLIFSCFEDWLANAWASELTSAAAGSQVDPPGHEPSGFAFADPDYARSILDSAGWTGATRQSFQFRYVAGSGAGAVDEALSLLCAIGPASLILRDLDESGRDQAVQRMRAVIERHFNGSEVAFPAAAVIWSVQA
ncbi:methyltransferase domain-containing protein [Sphingomonas sp.]|uniref:methyltransferase domain-containing protein n=1 Tax=Sphingomonas sp. TaxID=28214 RepID=UPI00286CFB0F|nr:methyltransferase domain-containing protein [Sphingomonas sp.]